MNVFLVIAAVLARLVSPAPAPPAHFLLVGDSMAASLSTPYVPAYARGGCGVTDQVVLKTNSATKSAECAAERDAWLGGMPDADVYLVLSSWEINDYAGAPFGSPEWDRIVTQSYERLLQLPGRVVLLTVPFRGPVNGRTYQSLDEMAEIDQMNRWYREFARTHRVGLVDLAELVCPQQQCLEVAGGVVLRPGDGAHFTAESAVWVTPQLLART